MRYIINIDGACRGNPGPASAGVILRDSTGKIVDKVGAYIGTATNNIAEYTSLIVGLKLALKHGANQILVRSDSQLMVRQMTGVYKIKSDHLRKLAMEAASLARQFDSIQYQSVPRAQNADADKIANEALDDATNKAKSPFSK